MLESRAKTLLAAVAREREERVAVAVVDDGRALAGAGELRRERLGELAGTLAVADPEHLVACDAPGSHARRGRERVERVAPARSARTLAAAVTSHSSGTELRPLGVVERALDDARAHVLLADQRGAGPRRRTRA